MVIRRETGVSWTWTPPCEYIRESPSQMLPLSTSLATSSLGMRTTAPGSCGRSSWMNKSGRACVRSRRLPDPHRMARVLLGEWAPVDNCFPRGSYVLQRCASSDVACCILPALWVGCVCLTYMLLPSLLKKIMQMQISMLRGFEAMSCGSR